MATPWHTLGVFFNKYFHPFNVNVGRYKKIRVKYFRMLYLYAKFYRNRHSWLMLLASF